MAAALARQADGATFDCQKGAAKSATTIGVFSFKQICQSKGAGADAHSLSYPQIQSADAAATRWNALAAKTAKTVFADNSPDEFDTSDISYSIGTASAKLISVHFDFYANTAGTAHPTIAQSDMNVTMPIAAPLRASELFKSTPQWKRFMAGQLGAAFTKLAGMSLSDAGIQMDTLAGQATNPRYWYIDAKGLTIETGDLGPPNSDVKATISWAALKPYLAASAPVP
jgi:hypothetical protein